METILGVDPGTRKCGFAVIGPGGRSLEQGIAAVDEFSAVVAGLRERYAVAVAALGAGTHARPIEHLLAAAGFRVVRVDERDTTLEARARYFEVHPPKGWRRLIPRGMLVPPRPIDDFAAILIAERYLRSAAPGGLPPYP